MTILLEDFAAGLWGGDPAYAVATLSSTSWGNLGSGTPMSLSLPMKGLYEVSIEATLMPDVVANAEAWIGFKTSATAASDSNGAVVTATGSGTRSSASVRKTSLLAVTAARTVTEQLKASTGASCTATYRKISARPLAIG